MNQFADKSGKLLNSHDSEQRPRNPPPFKVHDIVHHRASYQRAIVVGVGCHCSYGHDGEPCDWWNGMITIETCISSAPLTVEGWKYKQFSSEETADE